MTDMEEKRHIQTMLTRLLRVAELLTDEKPCDTIKSVDSIMPNLKESTSSIIAKESQVSESKQKQHKHDNL